VVGRALARLGIPAEAQLEAQLEPQLEPPLKARRAVQLVIVRKKVALAPSLNQAISGTPRATNFLCTGYLAEAI
jgi:hypothetical protein